MEFQLSHVERPLYLNCGLILMLLCPVVSIFLFRTRRVSRLMAIHLPLIGGGMLGWFGLRMAFMGLAISGGGGIAAMAAGIAEALMAVTVGAAASCVTGVIALFFARSERPAGSRRYWEWVIAGLGPLFIIELLVVIVMLLRGDVWHPDPRTLARIITLGGWSGLAIFIAALVALRSRIQQPIYMTFVALGSSLVIAIVTWLLQRRIMMSAMTGQLPF